MSIFRQHVALSCEPSPHEESIAELYHENTKLRQHTDVALDLVPAQDYAVEEIHAMTNACKRYAVHPHVELPELERLAGGGPSFDDVVSARRTVRSFADADLDLPTLAKLLRQTAGLTGSAQAPGGARFELRAAPSAGALYPAEIYLGVRRVDGLDPGIYHHEVRSSSLAMLRPGDPTAALHEVCCWQRYAREAAVVLLISGVLERPRRKYGERGYRYMLLDTGHMVQNLCLSATALGLAVTTTGGFFDDPANDLLGLDGLEEAVLYVAFVGRRGDELSSSPHPAILSG
jgi:SagB-type dehydrogenase family enzyme